MTRQNVTDGPREILTRQVPDLRRRRHRRLRRDRRARSSSGGCASSPSPVRARACRHTGSRSTRGRSRCSPARAARGSRRSRRRRGAASSSSRPRVTCTPTTSRSWPKGSRTTSQPEAPVDEGAEIEVKLVEVDLHDATAGGRQARRVDVVVADAAKLVGKKAKAVVGRVLEGQVFATLVERRAGRGADHVRERGGEADPRAGAEEGRGAPDDAEAAERARGRRARGDRRAEVEARLEGDAEAREQPRRRSGRHDGAGSRGGKRRKKPAAAAEDAGRRGRRAAAADETAAAEPRRRGGRRRHAREAAPPRRSGSRAIHVPDDDAETGDGPAAEPDAASRPTSRGEPTATGSERRRPCRRRRARGGARRSGRGAERAAAEPQGSRRSRTAPVRDGDVEAPDAAAEPPAKPATCRCGVVDDSTAGSDRSRARIHDWTRRRGSQRRDAGDVPMSDGSATSTAVPTAPTSSLQSVGSRALPAFSTSESTDS